MKKEPLILFGAGQIAEVADYYFTFDSPYEVVAFTVDAEYCRENSFLGRPLVPFETLEQAFDPQTHALFIALSYTGINALRRQRFLEAKARGYRLATYLSSRATVLNAGRIGENCFILEDNTLQPYSVIGDNVTLWSGNHIGHHSVIGDHSFLASHIVVSGGVEIGESAFIGVNVTLRDHIKVGSRCVLGAGALLLTDAEPDGVYMAEETPRSRVPSHRLRRL